jgi:catechol 2,3-dioxygenase-like lactoylglutathione lyase family enzyme
VIAVDHLAIPARDAAGAARFLGEILGVPPPVVDGPEGDMYCLQVGAVSLLFSEAATVASQHVAFRVDPATFAAVVERLRARGVKFGNDPADPANGKTADELGGHGRVYFIDGEGHLFEVAA